MPGQFSRLALKQGADFERRIPLADIAGISRRWQMMQHLIDVRLNNGETVSIRCEGATRFAAAIESAMTRLRASPA